MDHKVSQSLIIDMCQRTNQPVVVFKKKTQDNRAPHEYQRCVCLPGFLGYGVVNV